MTMRVLHLPSIVLASALLLSPFAAFSQSGNVALLIGNSTYQDSSSPLTTTVGDARVLADELRRQNFDVDLKENLGGDEMRRAVDAFMAKISSGTTAFFYFGGYGVQASRQNFLLPVNAQISTEAAVRREGIDLDATLAEIHRRGARIKVVIIDASRRNPYEAQEFRTSPIGLAPLLDTPSGTLAMYAAAPGKLVTDGKGTTSVLVTELVREMRVPARQAEEIFNRTRIAVSRASNNEQVPWVATSLTEPYQLGQLPPRPAAPPPPAVAAAPPPSHPPPPPVVATRPPPPPPPSPSVVAAPPPVAAPVPPPVVAPPPVARPDPEDEVRRDYQFADTVGTRKAWDDFLAKHRTGRYADAARDKIAKLTPPAPEPRPAPAPPRPQVTATPTPMPPTTPQPTPMVEGSEDPAIQELDAKIKQSPNDAVLYYKRGQLYAQHGSFRAPSRTSTS